MLAIWGTMRSLHQAPRTVPPFDPVNFSLAGLSLGQLAAAVLGALVVSTEYSTHAIRSTLTATPRRLRLLAAKGLVFVLVVLVAGLVTSFLAFFVSRPFLYDELLARIRAVLRRTAPIVPDLVHVGVLEIDRLTRRVAVAGNRIDLPAKEYELLLKLASEPSRVFTKEELLREVWGFRSIGKTRTLDSHASRLRRKLARGGGEPFVVNVWGVGYRLLED